MVVKEQWLLTKGTYSTTSWRRGEKRPCDDIRMARNLREKKNKVRKRSERIKKKKKVSIDRVKLFIVINYRSLSAASSFASRQSWKEGKRALLKPARASLFHVPRQRKSSSLAPNTHTTHTHTQPHLRFIFSAPPLPLSLPHSLPLSLFRFLCLTSGSSFGEPRAVFTERLFLAWIDEGSMARAD